MKKLTCNNSFVEIGDIEESSFRFLLENEFALSKKVIVVDVNTHDQCLEYLITTFETLEDAEVILLPVGEENKVMEVCYQVLQALAEYQITRNDLIITLGGGVVSDMGGFIASIYKRGLTCIHIPTSLLAMVDASLGGKTGIDCDGYKNLIGTFHEPHTVFIDYKFLATLPEPEWINGFAEIIKHILICDEEAWENLCKTDKDEMFNAEHVSQLIEHSVELKSQIVSEDPFEKGKRKILNFGHTVGHAIEGFYLGLEPMSHGNAVALGMIAESYMSVKKGFISEESLKQITAFLALYFPCPEDLLTGTGRIVELMQNDKKNDQEGVKTCLLNSIGNCTWGHVISIQEIKESLKFLYQVYYKN